WLSERFYGLRPLAILLGCGLLGGLWMAACLWYRAIEIPDVGLPFDLQAYVKSLPPPEENIAGQMIRAATHGFRDHRKQIGSNLPPPKWPFAGEPQWPRYPDTPVFQLYDWIVHEAVSKGWPKDDVDLTRFVDAMFAGDWAKEVRAAVRLPLGMVQDPRLTSWDSLIEEVQMCREVGSYFLARALQLSARGDHKGALELWETVLALSRHVAHPGFIIQYLVALGLQAGALDVLAENLQVLAQDPDGLRLVLARLRQHEGAMPPVQDTFKAEF